MTKIVHGLMFILAKMLSFLTQFRTKSAWISPQNWSLFIIFPFLLWTFYWQSSDIDNWFKYAVSIRSVSIRSDPIRRSECNVWWRYCVTVLRASNVSIRSPAAGTSKSPENLPRTAPAHLNPPGDLKLSLRLRRTRSSGRQCKLELSTNWFYQRNLCK